MLETDEVDDDYFTPIASTSLAHIFGSSSRHEDGTENESLKYTPPKPQCVAKPSSKVVECIFACALLAYEWFENVYSPKGKIGFAILKNIKSDSHEIVLYDSNKKNLSNTTVTSKLEVTIKGNLYFSYYDNLRKYWCLYASDEEIMKIVDLLNNLNTVIKHTPYTDQGPPEPNKIQNEYSTIQDPGVGNLESDTDSSLNKRTKDSILSRMANMGQSVLPRRVLSTERTSDSSDTNDANNQPKTLRHKPIRNIVKRINADNNAPDMHKLIEANHTLTPVAGNSLNNVPLYTCINGQLVPIVENSTVTGQGNKAENDMNLFWTEQRICNSEIRINIGRMSDKVDQMLNKFNDIGGDRCTSNSTSNFQMSLMQKLLTEYENKIKAYEQIITTNNYKKDSDVVSNSDIPKNTSSEIELHKNKILKLENTITEKNKEITKLNDDIIKLIKDKQVEITEPYPKNETELLNEITDLTNSLTLQQEELAKMSKKLKDVTLAGNPSNIGEEASKLKSIMNDTYRAIAVNFENNNNYAGETVKSIVATVIKQVTVDSLSDR